MKEKTFIIPEGTTEINYDTFGDNNRDFTSVVIPNSVTFIGYRAFLGFSNLKSINIPDSVIYIGCRAFNHCSSLININIPNSVTCIGSSAFENCTSLENINIPNSVNYICGYAFDGCIKLKKIYIPDSVTYIDVDAFSNSCFETIFCNSGSYAEQFFKENDINYEIIVSEDDASELVEDIEEKTFIIPEGTTEDKDTEVCSLERETFVKYISDFFSKKYYYDLSQLEDAELSWVYCFSVYDEIACSYIEFLCVFDCPFDSDCLKCFINEFVSIIFRRLSFNNFVNNFVDKFDLRFINKDGHIMLFSDNKLVLHFSIFYIKYVRTITL